MGVQQGEHLKKRCKYCSSVLEIKKRFIVRLKQYLLPFLLLPWLFGCDRLSDNGVKALKCKLWRDRGGTLNQQIYRDLTGKDKCIVTNNFGEMLSIKARKGISIPCNPNEQKSLLHEVNSICDAFLNQK